MRHTGPESQVMDFDVLESKYMINWIHDLGKNKSLGGWGVLSCSLGCCTFVSEIISVSYNHHLKSLLSSWPEVKAQTEIRAELCGLLWPSLIAGNFHTGPVERDVTESCQCRRRSAKKKKKLTHLNRVRANICGFNHILLQTRIYGCVCRYWPAGGSMTSQLVRLVGFLARCLRFRQQHGWGRHSWLNSGHYDSSETHSV